MSIISTVTPAQASGKVSEVYGQVQQVMGRVPNGMQLFSVSPELLAQQWQHLGYYMQHPTLSFPLLAMVRMLVSQENDCQYCVGFNESLLINMAGLTHEQVSVTKHNPLEAPLPDKDKAMLLFVLKATKVPKSVEKSDIAHLQSMGWSDGDIFDATQHGARNVAVDIVFSAFKVDNDF
jgi:uncharacterized peroxidase-related enzyme